MREIFTSGSVGSAPGNRCLYPEHRAGLLSVFFEHQLIIGLPYFWGGFRCSPSAGRRPAFYLGKSLTKYFCYCTIVQKIKMVILVDIVIDTSALIAVIVDEPERNKIIELTTGNTLIGPGSIPWEIGNAFSAMFKRNRLGLAAAQRGVEIFNSIPLRYIEPDFVKSVTISKQADIYAYDAYFIDCAIRQKSPLLTLDKKLKKAAQSMNVNTMEV